MLKHIIISITCATIFPQVASAATLFFEKTPGSKVNAGEAMKIMADQKPMFKCQTVSTGPNVNPVVVSGTLTTWHTNVGTPMESPVSALAEGKQLIRCEPVYIDVNTSRVRKAKI